MRDRDVPPLTVMLAPLRASPPFRSAEPENETAEVDALTDKLSDLASSQQCHLLELNHDLIRIVTHELCDPLRPHLAVNLSSTAKGLRVPMKEQLAELKSRHEKAAAMAKAWGRGMSCAQLADATSLHLGYHWGISLSLAHWETLGMLLDCGSLPNLEKLDIMGDQNGGKGVVSLADGLRRGRPPSLRFLALNYAQIGPEGVAALVPALTERALPSLEELHLASNPLGDEEMTALLPALRQLPKLKTLDLSYTRIRDAGVASLVAQPTAGALRSLETLHLEHCDVTDGGCATLATALHNGALPALKELSLKWIKASEQARNEVTAILKARSEA